MIRELIVHVVKAQYLAGLRIALEFEDGVVGEIDLRKAISRFPGRLQALQDPAYVARVTVSPHGTLTWPNGVELDPVVVYCSATGRPIPGTEAPGGRAVRRTKKSRPKSAGARSASTRAADADEEQALRSAGASARPGRMGDEEVTLRSSSQRLGRSIEANKAPIAASRSSRPARAPGEDRLARASDRSCAAVRNSRARLGSEASSTSSTSRTRRLRANLVDASQRNGLSNMFTGIVPDRSWFTP